MLDVIRFDVLVKFFSILGVLFSIYNIWRGTSLSWKPMRRDDYKFAKEFLADIQSFSPLHPYLIESGGAVILGKEGATLSEITYLLNQRNSLKAIKRYAAAGQEYVEYLESEGCISFRDKYKSKEKRKFLKIKYVILFVVFFSISFSPFLINYFVEKIKMDFFVSFFVFVGFLPQAIIFLFSAKNLQMGENLVASQNLAVVESSNSMTSGVDIDFVFFPENEEEFKKKALNNCVRTIVYNIDQSEIHSSFVRSVNVIWKQSCKNNIGTDHRIKNLVSGSFVIYSWIVNSDNDLTIPIFKNKPEIKNKYLKWRETTN
ncbi:hypothetical protein [Janthinobacterium sp. B9-8]|uniref:hypothetical protein n=1 Tax=Janthinobacterium sp. B9-8 TaxID=1236179 RepID=UPI00061CE369|nr:hypothetical protein [Janthinobacterium sp. B9-8]AMC35453.1 hypothetical protein VN23_12925 [Janthinobacterium sp. B9-8]